MPALIPQSPLFAPIRYNDQEYFASQYFHQQYLANSPHGGKHKRYDSFMRLLRSIEAYARYVSQGDIQEVAWNKDQPHFCGYLKPVFHAAGYHPLTLLNATAQLAMSHHLDDELSQQMSVSVNAYAVRQSAAPVVVESLAEGLLAQTRQLTQALECFVAMEKRQVLLEARQNAQDEKLQAILDRQPPIGKLRPGDWLRRHGKPRFSSDLMRQLNTVCARLAVAERWRPDGYDWPVPYYIPEVIERAYEEVTRQLSFIHDPGVEYQRRTPRR